MPLEITLQSPKTKIEIQDDIVMKLFLRNTGKEPIVISVPEKSQLWPVLKAKAEATGEVFVFRKKIETPGMPELSVTLQGGEKKEYSFWLKDQVEFSQPGAYEVTAEYEWDNGTGVAKSAAIMLEILPTIVLRSTLGMAQNAVTKSLTVFWTKRLKGKTLLMRTIVRNTNQAELGDTVEIGEFPADAEFVTSIAANKSNPFPTWLAWMQSDRLYHSFVDAEGKAEMPQSTKLPEGLLPRLLPSTFLTKSNHMEALMWLGTKEYDRAKLQLVLAQSDGQSGAGKDLILSSPVEPRWAGTTFLSTQERRAYFAYGEKGQVSLYSTLWDDEKPFEPLETRLSQKGRFVAAGLSLQEEDDVTGLLVTRPANKTDFLTVSRWTHYHDGRFESSEPEEVNFQYASVIDEYAIRFNDWRKPYAAVKPSGQPWHIREPEGSFTPIEGDAATAKGDLGLFFDNVGRPLLIFSRGELGLDIKTPTGNPPLPTDF